MPLNLALLRRLTQPPGIASREDLVRDLVYSELKPLVDDISIDVFGNLIGTRHGTSGPRIAIAAHMDEIGFIVRHVEETGHLRLQRVGGFDPRVLVAQRVQVHTRSGEMLPGVLQLAAKPVHLLQSGEHNDVKLEDLFVDLGLSADEVNLRVGVGDMVTLDRELSEVGNMVVSKTLDDCVGVFVMIEALRKAKSRFAEIIAIATTQEEIGLRGAKVAAFGIEADVALALDVTIAADIPGIPASDAVTQLGKGTAIKIFDSTHLPHPRLVTHLREIAERDRIPYQLEILPAGGTDAASFQT